jgi:hypothetical protein
VHERVLDDYISGVKRTIGDVVNDQLLPLMRVHGIFPKGYRFKWDDELKVSLEVRFKWVVELLGTKQFEIAADWIEQTFGIPVEEKPEPVLQPGLDGPPQPPGSPGGGSGGGGSQGSDTPNDQGDKTKKIVSVMPGVRELYNEAAHSHAH